MIMRREESVRVRKEYDERKVKLVKCDEGA
jgi:hypothetical protein